MSSGGRCGLTDMTYGAVIELAERPRVLEVPERIAEVLDDDHVARRAFARLSYEQQRWLVLTAGAGDPNPTLPTCP